MPRSTQKALGLSDLIKRLKQDLLDEQAQTEPKLFVIDEVTLEINFVVSGDIDSGFDLGVVTLGSKVAEERIQKVVIKMTPLVTKEKLLESLHALPKKAQASVQTTTDALVRSHGPTKTRGG